MNRIFLIVLLCALSVMSAAGIHQNRPQAVRELDSRWFSKFPLSSTGPLRGVLVSFWWIQVSELQMAYEFEKTAEVTEWICHLQPHLPAVWGYLAWNMGFNIAAEVESREEQWRWILRGIKHLEKGLVYSPESSELHYSLGWTVYSKVHGPRPFGVEFRKYLGQEPLEYAFDQFMLAKVHEGGHFSRAIFLLRLAKQLGKKEIFHLILKNLLKKHPDKKMVLLSIKKELLGVLP